METASKVIYNLVYSNHSLEIMVMGQHTKYLRNSFHGRILDQLDTYTNGN